VSPPGDLLLLQLAANHSGLPMRSCLLSLVLKCIIHQLFWEMLTGQRDARSTHPGQDNTALHIETGRKHKGFVYLRGSLTAMNKGVF